MLREWCTAKRRVGSHKLEGMLQMSQSHDHVVRRTKKDVTVAMKVVSVQNMEVANYPCRNMIRCDSPEIVEKAGRLACARANCVLQRVRFIK